MQNNSGKKGAPDKRRSRIRDRKKRQFLKTLIISFAAVAAVGMVFAVSLAIISAATGTAPDFFLISGKNSGKNHPIETPVQDMTAENPEAGAAGNLTVPDRNGTDSAGSGLTKAPGKETGESADGNTPGETGRHFSMPETESMTAQGLPQTAEDVRETAAAETPETPAPTEPFEIIREVQVNLAVPEEPKVAHLVAVGDNLMHRSVSMSGLKEDGSYNYDYNFSKAAPYISGADLAIINQETVIGGNELGIQGFPCFNGRTEMADALVRVGFDVVLGANNHILDQGVQPLIHMIRYFNTNYPQISVLGIHGSWEARDDLVVRDVNGIRIAMINYTDLLNIPSHWYGSEFSVEYLDYDRLAVLIDRAKAASDFVIVFPHWGTEYFLGVDGKEQEEAAFLAEHGVDLVIGTHPHVVEPVSYITRPDGGNMLIYYSLGNYQSIQNLEETMIGGMAQVEITKTRRGTRITDFNMEFLANDYRMSPGFRDYYDIVTTYPWELYSRELAETSWVHHDNQSFSVDKMFQIQAQMAAQVQTERENAGMPRH